MAMSDLTMTREPSQDDIEQLLPWYVTGKLAPGENRLVESYLEAHPAMRSQLALIEDEQTGATLNNEVIAPPSADQLAKLMAGIEASERRASPLAAIAGYVQRGLDWLSDRSALVPLATVAAVALLAQAGIIADWSLRPSAKAAYQTASVHPTAAETGSFALAGFVPTATVDQIERTLSPLGVVIVDGPKAGGIYRLRLAEKPLGDRDREIVVNALKAQSGVVRFVAPASP
jgi:hypothetical protein